MKNSRFWTGLALLMTPPMAIVVASAARLLAPIPTLEGRVTYQGYPVHGGLICFSSQDRRRSPDMVGLIDYNGHFVCQPEWAADQSGRAHFQIFILPDPRGSRSGRQQGDSHGSPVDDSSATAQIERRGDTSPSPRFTLASFGSPNPGSPDVLGRSGAAPRSSDDGPRPIEASLDSDIVHIDIDLTD